MDDGVIVLYFNDCMFGDFTFWVIVLISLIGLVIYVDDFITFFNLIIDLE